MHLHLFRLLLRFQLVRQGPEPVQHIWTKGGRVEFQTAMQKDVRRSRFAEESARHAVTSSGAPALTSLAAFATMRQMFRREIIRARSIRHHNEQPVPSECLGPSSSVQIHGTRMRETRGHSTELPVRHRMARSPSSSGMKDLLQMHRRLQIRSTTRRPGCPVKRDS